MKWKNKQNNRLIEVIGDEVVDRKKYRFFFYEDDPAQEIHKWDLIYADPWDETFEPVR